jgi:DNA-binding response OmpR family regulator
MKILTVDDNDQMRNLLRITFLQNPERELLQAKNGIEALNLVQQFNPDIVFLDVMMPGEIDGFEICRQIKSSNKTNCFVILLTAKSEKSDIEQGMAVGADMYLTKPFSPFNLIEIVKNFEKSKGVSIPLPDFSEPDEPSTAYDNLSGFDSKRLQILEIMLGSEDAVFAAIKKFVENFSDIPEKILHHSNENAHLARETLHLLKGAASNVGANHIADLAAKIDVLLKNDNDAKDKLSELFSEWRIVSATVMSMSH